MTKNNYAYVVFGIPEVNYPGILAGVNETDARNLKLGLFTGSSICLWRPVIVKLVPDPDKEGESQLTFIPFGEKKGDSVIFNVKNINFWYECSEDITKHYVRDFWEAKNPEAGFGILEPTVTAIRN